MEQSWHRRRGCRAAGPPGWAGSQWEVSSCGSSWGERSVFDVGTRQPSRPLRTIGRLAAPRAGAEPYRSGCGYPLLVRLDNVDEHLACRLHPERFIRQALDVYGNYWSLLLTPAKVKSNAFVATSTARIGRLMAGRALRQ